MMGAWFFGRSDERSGPGDEIHLLLLPFDIREVFSMRGWGKTKTNRT